MWKFVARQRSSFTYLNVTQFLGALNDNIFRLLLAFFLINLRGDEQRDQILALAGAVFVIPFLLFSASSGTLADRFSKRNIIVFSKLMEVVVMFLGLLAFYIEASIGAYIVLFFMATQSAIFSPSKYGIVPELVEPHRISQANGLLTSFTYGAIILGSFLGGFLSNVTERNFVFASAICVIIALVGLAASLKIEATPPAGSRRKVSPLFISEIIKTLRRVKREPTLLMAMFGSAYFLFMGGFIQLNIISYAKETLGMSEEWGAYLFFVIAIGIGSGGLLVGQISGKWVELGMVPIGGIAMSLGCILLDRFSNSLTTIIILILVTGVWSGIYLIPLDTFIQVMSPKRLRGQAVAATNFLAYIGVLFASGFFLVLGDGLGIKPDKAFTVVGILTLLVTSWMAFILRDYLIRFVGMVFSRVCFDMSIFGYEKLSPARPAVLITTYHTWTDSLMILGSQRRRIHFFIECRQGASTLVKWLRKFFKVTPSKALLPAQLDKSTIRRIRKALRRGQSVCIFMEESAKRNLDLVGVAEGYREILNKAGTPVIPVEVTKNPKDYPSESFFYRMHHYLRVPASVRFHVSSEDDVS